MNFVMVIPNKKIIYILLHILTSFFLLGIVSSYICDNLVHQICIGSYFIFHVVLGVELFKRTSTNPIIWDFRTQEQKLKQQEDTEELMVEAAKANLKLQVLEGTINPELVKNRLEALPQIDAIRYATTKQLAYSPEEIVNYGQ